MPANSWTVYGARGWGSAIAEALLVRCGAAYDFIDVTGFETDGPERERMLALNPLAQTPTLVMPDGTVMTESVAIALLLSEMFPNTGLAPPPGSPDRPRFLRRMVWLAAAVYSTFLYADFPDRWAPSAGEELAANVKDHRKAAWRSYEADLAAGEPADPRLATGVFVSVMTRWGPGRAWFAAECPRLFALATAVDSAEDLQEVWAANFPPK
jgi:GST-like protein